MAKMIRFVAPSILVVAITAVFASSFILPRTGAAQTSSGISIQDVGRDIYELRCGTCHGNRGEGTKGYQIPATGPALKGNPFIMAATEQAIADVIRNGRTGAKRRYDDTYPNMPSFDASMVPDMRPLVAYLKGDMQQEQD